MSDGLLTILITEHALVLAGVYTRYGGRDRLRKWGVCVEDQQEAGKGYGVSIEKTTFEARGKETFGGA